MFDHVLSGNPINASNRGELMIQTFSSSKYRKYFIFRYSTQFLRRLHIIFRIAIINFVIYPRF